jgi:hypothetical protein
MPAIGFGTDPGRAYVAMSQDEALPTNFATAVGTYLEVMPAATILASHQGEFASRPILDRPGQVVAFDTRTFAPASEKPALLPSVPVFLEHFAVPAGSPAAREATRNASARPGPRTHRPTARPPVAAPTRELAATGLSFPGSAAGLGLVAAALLMRRRNRRATDSSGG